MAVSSTAGQLVALELEGRDQWGNLSSELAAGCKIRLEPTGCGELLPCEVPHCAHTRVALTVLVQFVAGISLIGRLTAQVARAPQQQQLAQPSAPQQQLAQPSAPQQ